MDLLVGEAAEVSPLYSDACIKEELDVEEPLYCSQNYGPVLVKDEVTGLRYSGFQRKTARRKSHNSFVPPDTSLNVKNEAAEVKFESVKEEVWDEPCYTVGLEENVQAEGKRLRSSASLLYCDSCEFSSRYPNNLARHIKSAHMYVKPHKCPLCDLEFRFPGDLRQHSQVHKVNPMAFRCHLCPFQASKRYRVAHHIFKFHFYDSPEGDFVKIKTCYFCPYRTSNKMEFLNHFLDNHGQYSEGSGIKTSIHPCGLCSYTAYCQYRLIKHIDAVHKKFRPFACNLCDFAANRPQNLSIHISAKHEKIKPFQCDHCGYTTAYKPHVVRHILSQHVNKKERKSRWKD